MPRNSDFSSSNLTMRLVGRLLLLQRPVAHVLHAQRAGDDQHLAQRLALARRQDHPADARIERQLRQLAADRRQRVVVVGRAELVQQLVAVGDGALRRRLEEREVLDRAEVERLHPQDHAGQRRAHDLRLGEARPGGEVGLVVEADADAVGDPAAAAGALVRRRLAHRLDRQLLDLAAKAVALDPRRAGVDDVADAGHGERGLGDVGGEHDPARAVRREHLVLLLLAEAGEERQHLDPGRMVLPQLLGGVADLALAGQEDEHVAGAGGGDAASPLPERAAPELVDRVADRVAEIVVAAFLERPPADLDRIEPARDLQHRRRPVLRREVVGEALGVDRRRGDDDLQVGPARQDLAQVAEQEVDVQAALVRLVDDDRVVGAQQRVALGLGEQDAVGHQLDAGAGREPVLEADLVADDLAERRLQLLGDPPGDARGGDPARLGVADQAAAVGPAAAHRQRDLRQLGGLARAGLAADDDRLVRRAGPRRCRRGAPRPAATREIRSAESASLARAREGCAGAVASVPAIIPAGLPHCCRHCTKRQSHHEPHRGRSRRVDLARRRPRPGGAAAAAAAGQRARPALLLRRLDGGAGLARRGGARRHRDRPACATAWSRRRASTWSTRRSSAPADSRSTASRPSSGTRSPASTAAPRPSGASGSACTPTSRTTATACCACSACPKGRDTSRGAGRPQRSSAGAPTRSRTQAAARGLVVARLRSFEEWDRHPQAIAVAGLPLIEIERIGDAPPLAWPALAAEARPLEGLRVLDLTRILAGPVAGRTLAAFGADVMLVNSPTLPNISAIADTSRGKRSALADLHEPADRAAFAAALAERARHAAGLPPGRPRGARLRRRRKRRRCGPASSTSRSRPTGAPAPGRRGAASTRWCRPRPASTTPRARAFGAGRAARPADADPRHGLGLPARLRRRGGAAAPATRRRQLAGAGVARAHRALAALARPRSSDGFDAPQPDFAARMETERLGLRPAGGDPAGGACSRRRRPRYARPSVPPGHRSPRVGLTTAPAA